MPYTGNDTLTFVSDKGDTAVFTGQGRITYFKEESYINNCERRNRNYLERDETKFLSSSPEMEMKLILSGGVDIFINDDKIAKISALSAVYDSITFNGNTFYRSTQRMIQMIQTIYRRNLKR